MRSSRLAIAERIFKIFANSALLAFSNRLLLALAILPLALIYASSSFSSMRARAIHPRRCEWTTAYASSSSVSPAERRSGKPNARLGARGGGRSCDSWWARS